MVLKWQSGKPTNRAVLTANLPTRGTFYGGQWGTGSKQAVDLIFAENVCAIIGSSNGRNAHLVEQVAAKTRKVFLSAWAGDPTLAQAFVPWYFSCVPNDNQQAEVLIEEIYNKRKITKIAVVSDNSYDSKLALESFVKAKLVVKIRSVAAVL